MEDDGRAPAGEQAAQESRALMVRVETPEPPAPSRRDAALRLARRIGPARGAVALGVGMTVLGAVGRQLKYVPADAVRRAALPSGEAGALLPAVVEVVETLVVHRSERRTVKLPDGREVVEYASRTLRTRSVRGGGG